MRIQVWMLYTCPEGGERAHQVFATSAEAEAAAATAVSDFTSMTAEDDERPDVTAENWREQLEEYRARHDTGDECYIEDTFLDLPDTGAIAMLREAVDEWPQFDTDDAVSGADLVEWFGDWLARAKAYLAGAVEPAPITKHPHALTEAELAIVLAGLRLIQRQGVPGDLAEIATNGGKFSALGGADIDDLCERINA